MSAGYLLDTNVISELRKRERCDPKVAEWIAGVPADQIFLSILTVGEIRKGIESVRRRDAESAKALDLWYRRLCSLYAGRLIPVNQAIAEEWGRMNVPDPLPVIDGLLAATARIYGMVLVTKNVKDIARSSVEFFDPFSSR